MGSITLIVVVLFSIAATVTSIQLSDSWHHRAPLLHNNAKQPMAPPPPLQNSYSGYMTLNETAGSNMFYWFFVAQNKNMSAPIILWLEGGPGIPGTFSVFGGPGPFRFVGDPFTTGIQNLTLNEFSWNLEYHMIFVDNPVGVGFSYSDDPSAYALDQTDVANDLRTFLLLFYAKFPFVSGNDLYIFGESYGGKYVPSLAARLLDAKNNNEEGGDFNLKGVGMGDPLTDPISQITYWPGVGVYQGLFDANDEAYWSAQVDDLVNSIKNESWGLAANLLTVCTNMAESKKVSMYDTTTTIFSKEFIISFLYISYVNTTAWQKYLGVYPHVIPEYVSQSDFIVNFYDDLGKSELSDLEKIVSEYKVLVYNGQWDWLIAPVGTLNMLLSMQWSGASGFAAATNTVFDINVPNYPVSVAGGYIKQYGNLEYAVINNAGHFVPLDQPSVILSIVSNFINGVSN